jgi:hypothetical protein
VNTIQGTRTATRQGPKPRTLAAGRAGNADWQYLTSRRLALFIINSIERGTRWTSLMKPDHEAAEMLNTQVRTFLENLFVAGAFGTRRIDDAYFVLSDSRAVTRDARADEFQFLIGFAASREQEYHCYRISHSALGARVQPVSLNRMNYAQYSPAEIEWVDEMAAKLHS